MRRLLTLPLLLALPGCFIGTAQVGPTGADPTPAQMSAEARNTLTITRPSDVEFFSQAATSPVLLVEGREVGRCQVGRPLVIALADGDWIVSARTSGGEAWQRVEVYGGESVDMACGASGALNPRPVLGSVSR